MLSWNRNLEFGKWTDYRKKEGMILDDPLAQEKAIKRREKTHTNQKLWLDQTEEKQKRKKPITPDCGDFLIVPIPWLWRIDLFTSFSGSLNAPKVGRLDINPDVKIRLDNLNAPNLWHQTFLMAYGLQYNTPLLLWEGKLVGGQIGSMEN
jgi:hypothetical protein